MTSRLLLTAALALILLSATAACQRKPSETTETEKRERDFEQAMKGVVLIGHSSRTDREGISGEERYRIDGVKKIGGHAWLVQSRINFQGTSVPLPVPLEVYWAGDTPVLTLNEVSLPGLGTFSARVVIHNNEYAGTWSAGDHGGQMWGVIKKAEE